jgi:hypothetical protein
MNPSQSAEVFRRHVMLDAGDLRRTPLYDLIAAALSFYADQPAEGLAADEDSDMLLFQYGCYDWGEGELFEFDLTRQFVDARKTEAGAISQLRLTAYFAPDAELRDLGRASHWCGLREGLAEFRAVVFSSPAFVLAAARARVKVEIEWAAT